MKLWEFFWRADLKDKFVLEKFLCAFLSCSRESLWIDMDKELSDEVIQKVLAAYKSYVEDKKPLEFILWHVDFFWREFFVNEATLIPRPETEYMITAVKEYITSLKPESWSLKPNVLLDIGTGCGVLWISVLLQNPWYFKQAVLTDYFENALEIAKKNYETYKEEILSQNKSLDVQIFQSDLLTFLTNPSSQSPDTSSLLNACVSGNVILVANLPYIPEETFEMNAADNVKKWEPKPAFVWWSDGLDYYRIMFGQIIQLRGTRDEEQEKKTRSNAQCPLICFLEMMTRQVDILRQEFDDRMGFEEVKTFHFNIRIVKAYLK